MACEETLLPLPSLDNTVDDLLKSVSVAVMLLHGYEEHSYYQKQISQTGVGSLMCLFIYILFNNVSSSSEYISSNYKTNNELINTWK
jgi:hypothetical protein